MYFKIIAENVSSRVFNIAQNESHSHGNILRSVDRIGDKRVMLCCCQTMDDVADIVSTLETEREAFVLFVEDNKGKNINFRAIRELARPYYNRYTLSMA